MAAIDPSHKIAPPHKTASFDGDQSSHTALGRMAGIAWLAIGLGLAMQALILIGQLAGGAAVPDWTIVLASVFQGVSWSLIVCLGVGIGTMVMRAPIVLKGLFGFASAPLGLGTARGVQRGMNELAGGPDEPFFTLAVIAIALIKAVEYGFLTIMLARYIRRGEERLRTYLALGAGTGLIFGGVVVAASWHLTNSAGAALAAAALIGLVINEFLFPIGCAMVIYAIQFIGRHVRAVQSRDDEAPAAACEGKVAARVDRPVVRNA